MIVFLGAIAGAVIGSTLGTYIVAKKNKYFDEIVKTDSNTMEKFDSNIKECDEMIEFCQNKEKELEQEIKNY